MSDTGAFNPHLVRDFGASYLLVGLIVLVALDRNSFTRAVHFWVTLFFSLHAAIHVWDMLAGRLGHAHWAIDFPGVFLPVLVLLILSLPLAWNRPTLR